MELTEGNVLRDGPLERDCRGGVVRVTPIGEVGDLDQYLDQYLVQWIGGEGVTHAVRFVFFGSVRNHVGALADERVWRKAANDGL